MYKVNVLSFKYDDHLAVSNYNTKNYLCVFHASGKGVIHINDQKFPYEAPIITIVGPNQVYSEETSGLSRRFILTFKLLNDYLKPYISLKLNENLANIFLDHFNRMREVVDARDFMVQQDLNLLFEDFLAKFVTLSSTKKENHYQELINKVKNYIKENYMQKVDFNLIAASYGYSYNRFRHIFTDETGISIKQYLLDCRLEAAKDLLLNTNLSIKEVAYETGFTSNVHFTNFFTEREKMSPREFRKMNGKEN